MVCVITATEVKGVKVVEVLDLLVEDVLLDDVRVELVVPLVLGLVCAAVTGTGVVVVAAEATDTAVASCSITASRTTIAVLARRLPVRPACRLPSILPEETALSSFLLARVSAVASLQERVAALEHFSSNRRQSARVRCEDRYVGTVVSQTLARPDDEAVHAKAL